MDSNDIKADMLILAADDAAVAKVTHVNRFLIEAQDDAGNRHWFPVDWVARVDDAVHLDRIGEWATQEWSDLPPNELS